MKRVFKLLLAVLFLVCTSTASFAYTVDYSFDNDPVYTTGGIANFETTGADMTGMAVTVYFNDGTSDTQAWATTGTYSGAASGNTWSLATNGDTWDSSWYLNGHDLIGFSIDGIPGDTVFDTTYNPYPGTDDSANGYSLSVFGSDSGNIDVAYSGGLALDGYAPVGDLYLFMDVTFTDNDGNALALDYLSFRQDTDNVAISQDITPVNPVPEPGTFVLLGCGLAGLLGYRKYKK